jgi:hypothetical protein
MTPIETEIWAAFLARLAASAQVSDQVAQELRLALNGSKLAKGDDLAKLFARGSGGAVA